MKLYLIIYLLFLPSLIYAGTPNFLFIPIENTDHNANYAYIGKSVTDELRKQIAEKFAVREIPDRGWRSIARDNQFIYEDEYYTRSVALQLGIILKRDVVLSGGYSVEPSKKGGTDNVIFNVYLQNIRDKKIISHMNFSTPADATIFTKMNEFRDKMIVELAKVLPNKNDAERTYYEEEIMYFKNQLTVTGGSTFALKPSPIKEIPASGDVAFSPNDFELTPMFAVQYRRLNVFFDGFQLHAGAGFSFGSTDVDMVNSGNEVNVSHYSVSVNAGPGYRFMLFRKLYLCTQAGAGFYYAKTNIDMGMSGKEVTDPLTGDRINDIKMDIYAPTGRLDLILGYGILGNLSFEIGSGFRTYFGSDEISHQIIMYGGIVLGF